MYSTLAAATADLTTDCDSTQRRLVLKKILEQTELALINAATKGGIVQYQLNTGQTVINVKQSSVDELTKTYKSLLAVYNTICGIEEGSNVMIRRDAGSNVIALQNLRDS